MPLPARDVARLFGAARVVIGAGMVVAPRRALAGWLGRDAATPQGAVLGRAFGARDMVLGGIAMHTLDHPEVGARWQRTLAGIDAVDLVATLAARRHLPRAGVALTVVMATTAMAAQTWAAGRLAPPDESGG